MLDKNKDKKILENSKIRVQIEECIECLECVKTCPTSCYHFNGELRFDKLSNEYCIECGHCVAVCPVNIIQLKTYGEEECKDISMALQNLPSFESFSNLLHTRRSIRRFKKDPVPRELIEKILNITRYTPTGRNEENIFFTVVQDLQLVSKISQECTLEISNFVKTGEDPIGRESLKKVVSPREFEALNSNIHVFKRFLREMKTGRNPWCWDGNLIIIHSPKESSTLFQNCSMAAMNIMLAAQTLGLATCSLGYMTYFLNRFKSVSNLAKLPRKHTAVYTLAIGYPDVKYKRIPLRKPLKVEWL